MKAPAMFLVGASGAGKSSQVSTLIGACGDLKVVVACFDSGSAQAHAVAGVELAPLWSRNQKNGIQTLTEFLDRYPAESYIRVLDSWPGYEAVTVARRKKGDAVSLKQWSAIVGDWRDDLVVAYASSNAIIVGNISLGDRVVQTENGQQTVGRGMLHACPALSNPPVLASSAPIVLPLSSGGQGGTRSWVCGQLGTVASKFARKGMDGKPCFLYPGAEPGEKLVPVDRCSLADIWLSVAS